MSVGEEIQHLRDQIAQRDEVIARQAAEIVVLKQTIDALCRRVFGASSQPPFPRPPDRPNGCFRGLPPKANS